MQENEDPQNKQMGHYVYDLSFTTQVTQPC